MPTLNLGIVAHVDAGKTSLTERLLHQAGVIDRLGSVDAGSTQTDSLALERRRGITIRSAVVSFETPGGTVNLIDTPGHPDFIAEVERVLGVLDGAVLVVSAVEGVQPQTRILLRTLRRLRIPTLLFVNKIDRSGADPDRVTRDLAARLTPSVLPMGTVRDPGTRAAAFHPHPAADPAFTDALLESLTERDDTLLADWLRDPATVPHARLRAALAAQTARTQVHPVYFGSAVTGAGVPALTAALTDLLPAATGDPDAPPSGTVFKIERGPAGEKIAYVRMFDGTIRTRDVLSFGQDRSGKVTAVAVFDRGAAVRRDAVTAGHIGALRGLADVRIGDTLGAPRASAADHHFAPPTLSTVVEPARPADRGALHLALSQLAEQDPLINLRQDDRRQEISVSLYGEVQKEVIEATLAEDYGVPVAFRETTTIHIERPVGTGAAFEIISRDGNPFLATVGLRVDPAPPGAGVRFRLGVELGSMPYSFFAAVEETVHDTLAQGLHGWQVPDCTVTMTHSGYYARQSHAHGSFDKSMSSTAGDFRNLTPLVLMSALRRAGTVVHEPVHRFHLELPADLLGPILPALSRLGAIPRTSTVTAGTGILDGDLPAARVHALQQALPSLTRGEGLLESAFDRYRPVTGPPPDRPRSGHNPLNRREYLLHVVRRV